MEITMNEIKIYQKRSRLCILIFIDIVAFFMFYIFLRVGCYLNNLFFSIVGIIGLLFSILCFIIIVCHLIRPKVILIINEQGLVDQSSIPRIGQIFWSEILDFYIGKMFKKEFICVKLKDNSILYSRLMFWNAWFIRLNTPKCLEPVSISLEATSTDIHEVLKLLKSRLD
jgi:hypothetical protein